MGYAVWHASTAVCILITDIMEVSCDTALRLAALCLGVQVGHITECVLGIIGKSLLVMQHRVMSFNFL